MAQPQPLAPELERQREEYLQLLRSGRLSPYALPDVAHAVEGAVLERAWARTRCPFDGVGSRIYILSVAGTHGRVKVGSAGDVRGRIATHLNEYHCNGHGLVDAWISNSLLNAEELELALHKFLRISNRPSYRREEYPDGNFSSICEVASELDFRHSLTEEQVEFHLRDRRERRRKWEESLVHAVENEVDLAANDGGADRDAPSVG